MKPTLRLCAAPRSVSDATRFTANTLHANSKAATPPARFASPTSSPAPSSASAAGPGPSGRGSNAGSPPFLETPEQKVARLRAAHRRAKEAQVSKLDKVVDGGRRWFDSAHKTAVYALLGCTVIAGLATAYTAVDMIIYNKKRGAEWAEAQKKLEADSLEVARIAYMTGKATDDQIDLVEDQLKRERDSGRKTSFFSDISLLTPASATTNTSPSPPPPQPTPPATPPHQSINVTETVPWPSQQHATPPPPSPTTDSKPTRSSLWSWLTSNLKREEEGDDAHAPAQRRLGYESLSEEDDGSGVRASDLARAVEDREALVRARAAAAAAVAKTKKGDGDRDGAAVVVVRTEEGVGAAGKEEAVVVVGEGKKGWFW